MIKLALTGSIGMGKSTVAAMFERAGIPVFDADRVVRDLQSHGGALVEEIGRSFPGTVESGRLDRDRLAAIVLADPNALARLEALVHPAVRAAREGFLVEHAGAPAVLFDIPLLFETGGESAVDKVIVVSAPAQVQRVRVLARPGMTAAKLGSILARQLPDSDKRAQADFIVDTSAGLARTQAQVASIIACLGVGSG